MDTAYVSKRVATATQKNVRAQTAKIQRIIQKL